MVPAKTRDVTNDLLNRTNSSGVAPTKPSTKNNQVEGYSISNRFNNCRASIAEVDVAVKSRASTTFSSSPSLMDLIATAT